MCTEQAGCILVRTLDQEEAPNGGGVESRRHIVGSDPPTARQPLQLAHRPRLGHVEAAIKDT